MKSTAAKYSRLVMEWSWFTFFHQNPTPLRQDNDSTGLREHERLLCLNCAQTKMKFLLKPLSFFSHTCIKYRHIHNYAKLQFALPDTLKILSVFQEILNKILSGKNLPVLWRIQLFLPTALLELLLQKSRFVCFFGISAINNIRILGEQTGVLLVVKLTKYLIGKDNIGDQKPLH